MNAFFNKALVVTDDIIPREIGRMIEKDSGSFRVDPPFQAHRLPDKYNALRKPGRALYVVTFYKSFR